RRSSFAMSSDDTVSQRTAIEPRSIAIRQCDGRGGSSLHVFEPPLIASAERRDRLCVSARDQIYAETLIHHIHATHFECAHVEPVHLGGRRTLDDPDFHANPRRSSVVSRSRHAVSTTNNCRA